MPHCLLCDSGRQAKGEYTCGADTESELYSTLVKYRNIPQINLTKHIDCVVIYLGSNPEC